MPRTQLRPDTRGGVQVRAAAVADCQDISSFVAGLSLRTRFLRFFAPASPPSSAVLRGLCGAADGTDVLVATDRGEIVGHAMAVDNTGPDGRGVAEIGLVVADRWQSHGVGSELLRRVAERAVARGVSVLAMDVLPENRRMLAMISRRWADATYEFRAGAVTVQVRLPGSPQRSGSTEVGPQQNAPLRDAGGPAGVAA